MIRGLNIAGNTGVFAILVHALSDQARQFYLSRGFVASPLQPMTLLMKPFDQSLQNRIEALPPSAKPPLEMTHLPARKKWFSLLHARWNALM